MELFDFHTHILPNMDDGSKGIEESLSMLTEMNRQGVKSVVASSHFYAIKESPQSFLRRREESAKKLKEVLHENLPNVYLGAEVCYFKDMSLSEEIKNLCISGTDYIMIEMPFMTWSPFVINDIYEIRENLGLNPILAHIECFLEFGNKKAIRQLADNGIIMQSNADFFLGKNSKIAFDFLEKNLINVLGSDSHHIDTRKPNLKSAIDVIEINKKKSLELIFENSKEILSEAIKL